MKRKKKQKPYDYLIFIVPLAAILIVGFISVVFEKRMCKNLSHRINTTQSRLRDIKNTFRPTEYQRVIISPNVPTPSPSLSLTPTPTPAPTPRNQKLLPSDAGEPILY